jgi:hypothetical protein
VPGSRFNATRPARGVLRSAPRAFGLATALLIGDVVEAFVCYDKRLSAAADALGLHTTVP